MKKTLRITLILLLVVLTGSATAHVRMLIRNTNWYYSRHHCFIGIPWREAAGETGMGRGATELRVGGGDVTFVHEDIHGIWPPIAYQCPKRLPGGPEVALDLTFKWIYVADGLCWSHGCKTYAQTFIAEGMELVSVRCFVASPPRPINVTLHQGGPDGPQIGSTKQFDAGTAAWGLVFWQAGEAPTIPGKQYTIVLESADGSLWNPYFHSKGNCYDDGIAYFEGIPQPDTDMCLLISNPGDGYIRHITTPNDPRDTNQWSGVPNGQRFIARARNLIFASAEMLCGGPDDKKETCYLVIRKDEPVGEQIGHRMRLAHMPGNERSIKHRGIPYGPRSIDLEIGKTYYAVVEYKDGSQPNNWKVRARFYGEQAPGSHPTIASVWTKRIFPRKPGGKVLGTVEEMNEEGGAAIGGLDPDTVYQFRIIAESPQAYNYYSPWYLVRTRAENGTLDKVEPMQHFGVFDPYFLPVADAPLGVAPGRPARAKGKEVKIENPGFENGVKGWKIAENLKPNTTRTVQDIKAYQGSNMFGWLRELKGEPDHELYKKDWITQKVKVIPDKWYQLSVMYITAEPDWTARKYVDETWGFPFFQNRCRDRIALAVDASGGEYFESANVTQWYSSEGKWMLITKDFQAKSDEITIGAAFYQRGEREWDAAYIDDFKMVELDKAPY